MKETFLIKLHGRRLGWSSFFIRFDNSVWTGVSRTDKYELAQRFVDYHSAELYLKSNAERFKDYFACSIEKFFIV